MVLPHGPREKSPQATINTPQAGVLFLFSRGDENQWSTSPSHSEGFFFFGRPLFALTWAGATC